MTCSAPRCCRARRVDILDFRRQICGSEEVEAALAPHRDALHSIFGKYALTEGATLASRDGLPLRRFLEMVRDAGLIGTALSRHAASVAFAASLDFKQGSKPCLKPAAEFEEAVVRLSLAFDPTRVKEPTPRYRDVTAKATAADVGDTLADKISYVCGKLRGAAGSLDA